MSYPPGVVRGVIGWMKSRLGVPEVDDKVSFSEPTPTTPLDGRSAVLIRSEFYNKKGKLVESRFGTANITGVSDVAAHRLDVATVKHASVPGQLTGAPLVFIGGNKLKQQATIRIIKKTNYIHLALDGVMTTFWSPEGHRVIARASLEPNLSDEAWNKQPIVFLHSNLPQASRWTETEPTHWANYIALAGVDFPEEEVADLVRPSLPCTPPDDENTPQEDSPKTVSGFGYAQGGTPFLNPGKLHYIKGVYGWYGRMHAWFHQHAVGMLKGCDGQGLGTEDGIHQFLTLGVLPTALTVEPEGKPVNSLLTMRTDNPAYLCGFAKWNLEHNTEDEKKKILTGLYTKQNLEYMNKVCPREHGSVTELREKLVGQEPVVAEVESAVSDVGVGAVPDVAAVEKVEEKAPAVPSEEAEPPPQWRWWKGRRKEDSSA